MLCPAAMDAMDRIRVEDQEFEKLMSAPRPGSYRTVSRRTRRAKLKCGWSAADGAVSDVNNQSVSDVNNQSRSDDGAMELAAVAESTLPAAPSAEGAWLTVPEAELSGGGELRPAVMPVSVVGVPDPSVAETTKDEGVVSICEIGHAAFGGSEGMCAAVASVSPATSMVDGAHVASNLSLPRMVGLLCRRWQGTRACWCRRRQRPRRQRMSSCSIQGGAPLTRHVSMGGALLTLHVSMGGAPLTRTFQGCKLDGGRPADASCIDGGRPADASCIDGGRPADAYFSRV